jgi:hypothetical protein
VKNEQKMGKSKQKPKLICANNLLMKKRKTKKNAHNAQKRAVKNFFWDNVQKSVKTGKKLKIKFIN